jgi:hypothetical protein
MGEDVLHLILLHALASHSSQDMQEIIVQFVSNCVHSSNRPLNLNQHNVMIKPSFLMDAEQEDV